MIKKLSIITPAYNEEGTLAEMIGRVLKVNFPLPREIIIVDDGSQDATGKIAQDLARKNKDVKFFAHAKNSGKGSAVRTGISKATGDHIVVQDADLEYDPNDMLRMISEVENGASVVYGSRLTQAPVLFGKNRTPILLHYFGNKFLSLITSLLYRAWITDMETCYKLFPKSALAGVTLRARGFELEPEITAKLLKRGHKIKEIPITTKPRSFEEGKKLNTFRDGYKALLALVKYRFTD